MFAIINNNTVEFFSKIWTSNLAERAGLRGNRIPPQTPYVIDRDRVLHEVIIRNPSQPLDRFQVIQETLTEIDGSWFLVREAVDVSLDRGKEILKDAIKANRDRVINGGYEWERTSTGETFVVDTDNQSLARINGAFSLAQNGFVGAEGIPWRMATNDVPVLSSTEILELASSIGLYVSNAYRIQSTLESQVESAISMAELRAIDIDSPFPETPAILQLV